MSRRELKRRHHTSTEFLHRARKLTHEQADRFKLMFSRCRTPTDFTQVRKALDDFLCIHLATDRHALIMREDDWFADDDALPSGCG